MSARWLNRWLVTFVLLTSASLASARDLPDFSALVDANGRAVVNISAQRDPVADEVPLRPNLIPGRPGRIDRMPPGHGAQPEEDDGDPAVGTGFIIDPAGYILTNAHVVNRADQIIVRMSDKREFRAHLVGSDKRTDVALLKIDASGLPVVRTGDPSKLKVGDWVLAIGSPFGFEQSVTAGIVSAKGRSLPDESYTPFIQTDVAINPGNSGGPLFNLNGEVVGINAQIFSRTGGFMGLSFAIPIDVALAVQQQLRESGKVSRGKIGVLIQEVSKEIAEAFGLAGPSGALVSMVENGSPAQRAGIRQGDVLVSFNGQKVETSSDLPRIVGATAPGASVPVRYWRGLSMQEAQVRVGLMDEEIEPPQRTVRAARSGSLFDRLGLAVGEATAMQRLDLKISGGVVVRRSRGPAALAEIEPGDVIEAVVLRGKRIGVESVSQFRRLIEPLEAGQGLSLLVRRGEISSFVGLRVDG
ncbi:MAG: Do family serine endopeptidase [Zoogloeaceae bacterium]|nr:Do family serine endopeptidase [Rhodocyclaceae bacterium]MCP5238646.1 Do family serine endopeptidase [Zoogloeaceae bacterium]MCP5254439.1 Do family serine endopeptidase [Zoogloeaceae bacterium]MCP5295643.1 Do family serine endopeptidase [Zoogloeaceae bacterium]